MPTRKPSDYAPELAEETLQVWHLQGLSTEQLDLVHRMLVQFYRRLSPDFDQLTRDLLMAEATKLLFVRAGTL